MDDAAPRRLPDARRGRASALPWDHAPATASHRPSAYAHYKKLVRDAETLDDDLEQSRLAQEALEAQLQRHRAAVETHATTQRDAELAAWTRERDRRVEALCSHGAAVDALHQEHAELEDHELRLLAELDVLHERQHEANETEAKRVFDLVHVRTSQLEKELEKGQMDVAYLTQVISSAKRTVLVDSDSQGQGDTIHAVVGTIRQRRQDALRDATAEFHQRLQSFELEKQALQRKADEITYKKQRALQLLSSNQQQVIADFFTTPRAAIQQANPPLPSLEFDAIVEAMKQPTGDVVRRLQDLEHSKASARRHLSDALAAAERNLESGPRKLDAIQQQMLARQHDAVRLRIAPSTLSAAYEGAWSVETYRPDQYDVVYFVRSLVFAWMDHALAIADRQPATQLLELEIRRHDATHVVLEAVEQRRWLAQCAVTIADEIERDVVRELAESIRHEVLFTADKVRDVIQRELHEVLFVSIAQQPLPSPQRHPKPSVKAGAGDHGSTPLTLRSSMFRAAWQEIQRHHEGDALPATRRLPKLLMRPAETQAATTTTSTLDAASPTKKRFGFFGGTATKPPPLVAQSKMPSPVKPPQVQQRLPDQDDTSGVTDWPLRRALVTEVPLADPSSHDRSSFIDRERTLWEHNVSITDSCFTSLLTCSFVSCLQLAPDAQLLGIGSLDGEVMVFALGDPASPTPTAVRVSPADKTATTSSVLGVARITRLCFSGCARQLLSYNQLRVATLWTLTSPSPPSHSADCFATENPKARVPALRLVSVLEPVKLFCEPPVAAAVLERDAPVVAARLQAAPLVTISALSFFPSVSLIGEPSHVLCGASTGDILKATTVSTEKNEGLQRLIGPANAAAFEVPSPQDVELRVCLGSSRPCRRELFRSAHRQSVLFVSAIASLPSSPLQTRLISVDQRGGVALWLYARASFSGFGWFVPHATYQLDLSVRGSNTGDGARAITDVGEILQIQLAPDRKTLVLMVFLASPPPAAATAQHLKRPTQSTASTTGRLRFVQLDLTTNELTVKQVRLERDLVGAIPPRFALIAWRSPPPPSVTKRPRSAATTPRVRESTFLILLMDNALHILSLQTGEVCRPVISLHTTATSDSKARTRRNDESPTRLLFNSITASSGAAVRSKGAVVAVAGEQHRQVRIFHFNNTLNS